MKAAAQAVKHVVGRDEELAAVVSALETAHADGLVLVLEGEAGIGKTTLLRAGVAAARERGHRILACAASDAEAQLSFAGLRDLVGDALDEVADDLPEPQRRALAVTLHREDPGGAPPDPGAVGVAFVAIVRALATRGPVLLAVEDAHWLDPASAGTLAYAGRTHPDGDRSGTEPECSSTTWPTATRSAARMPAT